MLKVSYFLRTAILSLTLPVIGLNAFPQSCGSGERQVVRIPCLTGYMTYPPRTEACTFSAPAGWAIDASSFFERSLPGTGGSVAVVPRNTADPIVRKQYLLRAIQRIHTFVEGDNYNAALQQLPLFTEMLASTTPLYIAAEARVTLISLGSSPFPPCTPGNTSNYCPHIRVDPIEVRIFCLAL